MNKATLYIFSGLPGSGKSTLAQALSLHTGVAYLRIDTVEQALRDLCNYDVEGEGYRLSYRVISDNLKLGISFIVDACNPLQLTRDEWHDVAKEQGAAFIDIEICCSDACEHQQRVETRKNSVKGLKLPDWEQVKNREYHPWITERVVIDTAGKTMDESFRELLKGLKKREL